MALWNLVLDDLLFAAGEQSENMLRFAFEKHESAGFLFQFLASVVGAHDSRRAALLQGYALTDYRRRAEWQPAIMCAYDSLSIPLLYLPALEVLLHAALAGGQKGLIDSHAQFLCDQARQQILTAHELVMLFFAALSPLYSDGQKEEEVMQMRKVLHAYDPKLNALLYTYLQAHLHSYTTQVAEELRGKRDIFAGG